MRNTQDSTGAEQPTNLRDAAPAASEQLDQGWVASLLRPLLVVVLVSSIDLVLLTFLRQYAPGMTPAVRWSIVGMGVLAAIIGCATTTWLAQPAQRLRRSAAYRLAEIALLVAAIRAVLWLAEGTLPSPLAMVNDPTGVFADGAFLFALLVVLLTWYAAIDFTDPTTYNSATSLTVYDALGQDVALTYYFQKAATDTWNVFITANGTPINGTTVAPLASTTISFPATGGAPTAPVGTVSIDIPVTTNANGAQTRAITGVALDVDGARQYGAPFGVTNLSQNGYAPGQITGVTIESDGIIMARYSNGQNQPAGQIELATFRNPQGLQPLGGNAWARSATSGDPVVGVPGDGNLGVLQAGALEESNVDLTAELVNMMTAQRVYQANAQTIRTQDQVLQTLVQLR